jgi:hypothetical protein
MGGLGQRFAIHQHPQFPTRKVGDIPKEDVLIVPYKSVGSCLDPGLPGTCLQGGGVRCGARPTQFKGKVSWNPAEMGEQ